MIHYVKNKNQKSDGYAGPFDPMNCQAAYDFHRTMPQYRKTDFVPLPALAASLNIKSVYVKDESQRFSLNAFKALGASYAIARTIYEKAGLADETVDYKELFRGRAVQASNGLEFSSATDGNHGRGLAWFASLLGLKSHILMPAGTTQSRYDNIAKLGAQTQITDVPYDDTVRQALNLSRDNGWSIVQDTAWEGYEQIPRWIMQGYATIAFEIFEQLREKPTHLFLQAGVGAFAGAMVGMFKAHYGAEAPRFIIVEPTNADCIFQSVQAGQLTSVGGSLETIMAGLSCGEPNPLGLELILDYADDCLSISDDVARTGMQRLYHPLKTDKRIVSGESGSPGIGALIETCMREPAIRANLELDVHSVVLAISTEGDTDPVIFNEVVREKPSDPA